MTDEEREPFERALNDAAFLAWFVDAYRGEADPLDALRWLRDPDAPGRDGRPGPGTAVRAARVALFRPDAGDRQRQEHARLVQALAALRAETLEAIEAATRHDAHGLPRASAARVDDAVTARTRRGRLRRSALGGLALALVLGVAGVLWTVDGGRSTPAASLVATDAPLADVISAQPWQLPAKWRTGTVVTSSDQLDGELALLTQAGDQGPLLLVVRCAAEDRSFQAVVSGGGQRLVRRGTCGRLQTIALPDRSGGLVEVVVKTRGSLPFSGALVRPSMARRPR